jgi:hypothetical protein
MQSAVAGDAAVSGSPLADSRSASPASARPSCTSRVCQPAPTRGADRAAVARRDDRLVYSLDEVAALVAPFADDWTQGWWGTVRGAVGVALFGAALVIPVAVGLIVLAGLGVRLSSTMDSDGLLAAAVLLVLAAAGCLLYVGRVVCSVRSPFRARWFDIAEYVTLISLVPGRRRGSRYI